MPNQGFMFLQTNYAKGGPSGIRDIFFSTSPDGRKWTEPKLYGAVELGHYQVSWSDGKKVGAAFNMHPQPKGLNWRTNLYYMESSDFGKTWRTAAGNQLHLPLETASNPALIHDYKSEERNVYVMDVNFDAEGRPVVLYLTSKGWEAGPKNGPRTWHTAWWSGKEWKINKTIQSNSNYDMGSIWIEPNQWKIIGPTEPGPQAYNPGGEIAMLISRDHGETWQKLKQLTAGSQFNHGYCRRPVNANPEFYSLWADGHGRHKSDSRLYFTDREGTHVWRLPTNMTSDAAKPKVISFE
jgi:hypothetical protein